MFYSTYFCSIIEKNRMLVDFYFSTLSSDINRTYDHCSQYFLWQKYFLFFFFKHFCFIYFLNSLVCFHKILMVKIYNARLGRNPLRISLEVIRQFDNNNFSKFSIFPMVRPSWPIRFERFWLPKFNSWIFAPPMAPKSAFRWKCGWFLNVTFWRLIHPDRLLWPELWKVASRIPSKNITVMSVYKKKLPKIIKLLL